MLGNKLVFYKVKNILFLVMMVNIALYLPFSFPGALEPGGLFKKS